MNKMRLIHPGEILRQELEELNLSANALARKLHVPPNRITAILNEQRSLTADTALRLAKYFGTTAEFWLNLQMTYDLKSELKRSGKEIDEQVEHRDAA